MTGRHDEPGVRPEAQWYPPGGDQEADYGSQPDYGPAGGPSEHQPGPTYVDHPSGPSRVDQSAPEPRAAEQGQPGPGRADQLPGRPYRVDRHPSGPHQTGQHPAGPHSSGPHLTGPAGSYPSGPYPVDQSGPYRVDPQQQPPHPQQPPQPHPAQPHPAGAPDQQQPYQQSSPYQSQGPGPQGPAPYGPHLARETSPAVHDLSSAQLLRQTKRPPQSGWRRAVYVATGHTVNFGESPDDRARRELIARINQPLNGCYKIAMLSLKGGVGKTTTTTSLGSTFASLRGDRVIAVDANPDRGTLSQKIPLETTATVRHLLRDAQRIRRYSDVRAYTSQGPSRLEVLASEQDPAVSEAFSEDDYRRNVNLLEHFYNVVLTDCGTGLMHSAMKGVLDVADSLVIVSSGSIDGARSASATLDWLDAHGYRLLVARSVAVINSVRPKSGKVDLNKVSEHFAARCRAVCRIPFDPHFEEGAEVELDQLQEPTRLALLELAATVADDFPHASSRARSR